MIDNSDAVKLLDSKRDGAIFVATMNANNVHFGLPTVTSNEKLDFPISGAMSKASDVALGLAGGALAGGVAYAIRYAFKRLRGRDALGLGDVKYFAVAGLWLGPSGLPAFMVVTGVAGIAFALLWRRLGGGCEFPFGPALALGLFICLLFPELVRLFA